MKKNDISDYDLILCNAENKIIKSCGDIIITENCIDSDLYAGKNVHIKGKLICNKNCIIIGNSIEFDKDIFLNDNSTLTIHAGSDIKIKEKLKSLNNKIIKIESQLVDITNAINEQLNLISEDKIYKLLDRQRILNSLLQYWKRKKHFIENENIDLSEAFVLFRGIATNNIEITINQQSLKIDSPVKNIKFFLSPLNKIVGIKLNQQIINNENKER